MRIDAELASSPTWFPMIADERMERIGFIRLSEADYRAASFLDQRILAAHPAPVWSNRDAVRLATASLPLRADFIFHIGHVGSTLLSRMLGEHPDLFCLREPALLRTLADRSALLGGDAAHETGEVWEERLQVVLRLWSRTWRPEQRAVIKATSFVAALAPELLRMDPAARALMLFLSPLSYLRTIFGGEASRLELRAMAPLRRARLDRALAGGSAQAAPLSEGEAVAMSWLCEMTSLHQAAATARGRVLWLDFDRVLAAPAPALSRALTHLRAAHTPADAEVIAAGPLMTRYSKAPEHAYGPALRQQVLAQADRTHAAEIRKGMDWLGRMAAAHAPVREVLEASVQRRR